MNCIWITKRTPEKWKTKQKSSFYIISNSKPKLSKAFNPKVIAVREGTIACGKILGLWNLQVAPGFTQRSFLVEKQDQNRLGVEKWTKWEWQDQIMLTPGPSCSPEGLRGPDRSLGATRQTVRIWRKESQLKVRQDEFCSWSSVESRRWSWASWEWSACVSVCEEVPLYLASSRGQIGDIVSVLWGLSFP